ncbi:FAD-binding oxidoreductase [Candidatus Symbiobacter mobilis]|uniref:FAD/FMN-containing dehydrogenase n=1 Tax=Candidatus Symbiobacter mobilis CR TaxID=946483 RepID=U5NE13_9BURK|nr:FAD-binding oxidoreductase [Candidatus Symbiobacter mobilis]AGX88458.1 FAD/FMN-containing dehydrogenase [Candidatus Symbiobacter mobilis CR]
MDALLGALRGIVGDGHVLTGGDLGAWERDWRGRARGKALAVVRPACTQEVADVVRATAAYVQQHPDCGIGIVPQGGNTGLVLGSTPDESGTMLVLSLRRMQAVRNVDATNLSMTVDAGCIIDTLHECTSAQGLWLPLSLAAEASCTVGGVLSTNAGGTRVLRFGTARDFCLGLEVVTATGEVWDGLRGLRKDNTGYDLRQLFIGSEGTLGIVTAATLRLYPAPKACWVAWADVPDMASALGLLERARYSLGDALTAFELMDRSALDLVRKHRPALRVPLYPSGAYAVLLEYCATDAGMRAPLEDTLAAAMQQGCATDAVLAENARQSRAFWQVREAIPEAQAQEGPSVKHDVSLPLGAMSSFLDATAAALCAAIPGVRVLHFGHLGDGNLHYNVFPPEHVDGRAFVRDEEERINDLVFAQVTAHGGAIAAEHGIGSLRARRLAQVEPPVAMAMMHAIKKALDPTNLLNPGRVLLHSVQNPCMEKRPCLP